MTRRTLLSLALLSLAAAPSCRSAQPPGPGGPPADDADDPTPAAPASAVHHHSAGLIDLAGVAALPAATRVPVEGYPGKARHLGAVTDAAAWRALEPALPEGFPEIDWSRQMVVYAVLDAQTNALDFSGWNARDGVATLRIEWAGIEPFYADSTPGVFALVDRGSIQRVRVITSREGEPEAELGSFEL